MREINKCFNKNAFQWDAYCPLVDRIPACTVGGVYLSGGVYLPGGVSAWECTCPGTPPSVNRMTDRCKNITLPQTSFAAVNTELASFNT